MATSELHTLDIESDDEDLYGVDPREPTHGIVADAPIDANQPANKLPDVPLDRLVSGMDSVPNAKAAASPRVAQIAAAKRAALPWYQKIFSFLGWSSFFGPLITLEDVGLSPEEIEQCRMIVPFTSGELNQLAEKFLEVDADEDGTITFLEFMSMPEFCGSPLIDRMISVFGRTADDRLNFIDFLSLLAVFSDGTSKGEKMEFLFQIYDCDGDGFISKDDLLSIFKRVTAATVEPQILDQVVAKTFEECDHNQDDFIDLKEFANVVKNADIQATLRMKL